MEKMEKRGKTKGKKKFFEAKIGLLRLCMGGGRNEQIWLDYIAVKPKIMCIFAFLCENEDISAEMSVIKERKRA